MCKANLNQLTRFIQRNLDKPRSLYEWKDDFNQFLPTNRRLSSRELAFAFKVINQKNILNVEKDSTYYSFSEFLEVPVLSTIHNY